MSRFKLLIEYAGTRYSGWQIQKNARTIQGELAAAISTATSVAEFELYGAGRTDAGVHALGQVAHLDLAVNTPPDVLRRQINDALPPDINVLVVEKVPHRFHARHDALARSYLYQVSRRRTAFAKPFVWWVKEELHVRAMREAARALTGRHDFRSFTDEDPELASTVVEVEGLELKEAGDLILVRITGSHFIWKMVRRIVGVLVEVGRGQLPAGRVQEFLTEASEIPSRLTAPASGLFLERVLYEGDRRDVPLVPAVSLTLCVLAHAQAPSSGAPPEPA
jgi:tRNA pseudouridine38-40 synthase